MTSRIIAIAVDCRDAESLARFWCAAPDYPSTRRWKDAYGLEYVESNAPGSPSLVFQPVDDPNVPWAVLADPEGTNSACYRNVEPTTGRPRSPRHQAAGPPWATQCRTWST
ncbi:MULTISPECIES: VOC family protein [Rhodococcus]|nr:MULTISPECIES: VOC family protein [Rhodococcus]